MHIHKHSHIYNHSPAEQLNHLEWLLNGMVYKNGTHGANRYRLLLFIRPVTLSHAGRWECRAVFTNGTTSSPVNAGTLTVYGEYRYHHNIIARILLSFVYT